MGAFVMSLWLLCLYWTVSDADETCRDTDDKRGPITYDMYIEDDKTIRIYNSSDNQWMGVCDGGIHYSAKFTICLQTNGTGLFEPSNISDYAYKHIKCPTVANYERNGEVNIFRCEFGNRVDASSCILAKVNCENITLGSMYNGQVDLYDDPNRSKFQGQLRVYENNEWLYFCWSDKFIISSLADSVCRQLGATGAKEFCSYSSESRGTNVIINSTTSQCSNHSVNCFSYCYNTEDLEYGRCPNDQYIYIYCENIENLSKLQTSGSRISCTLEHMNRQTNTELKKYEIATWILTGGLSLAVIILLFCVGRAYIKVPHVCHCDYEHVPNDGNIDIPNDQRDEAM